MTEKQNAEELEKENNPKFQGSLHPRYDWLDQYRGMVIVFLVIASLTWIFSSENFLIAQPIGPVWLNHGWKFYEQNPNMITIIDLGSQIFMYMLGISLGLSFKSKVAKKGLPFAWLTVFHRVFSFFWIAQVLELDFEFPTLKIVAVVSWVVITVLAAVFRNLRKYKDSIMRPLIGMLWSLISIGLWCVQARLPNVIGSGYLRAVFFEEAIAHLAWGTLIGAIFVWLIKNPDIRIFITLVMFVGHAIMWEYKAVINTTIKAFWPQWEIPFDVIGMGAISVAATCVWDWMNIDPKDQLKGMRKRVIPFFLLCGVTHFIVDFFQPAEHKGINFSLGLLAMAFSTLLVLIFYSLEFFYKFKIPFLTHIGRNALFLFLFQGIFTITYPEIIGWNNAHVFRAQMASLLGVGDLMHPLVDLAGLIAFILPMMIMYLVAWLFDRYNIHIKV